MKPADPAAKPDAKTKRPKTKRNAALRDARRTIRAARGSPVPTTPAHAVVRAAEAVRTKRPVHCSRFGAPGGGYLAVLAPDVAGSAAVGPVSVTPQSKIRRVDRTEAHAIIKRARRPDGTPGRDKIVELYWLPPELVALFARSVLIDMVRSRMLSPVWTIWRGRCAERGDSVVGHPRGGGVRR